MLRSKRLGHGDLNARCRQSEVSKANEVREELCLKWTEVIKQKISRLPNNAGYQ